MSAGAAGISRSALRPDALTSTAHGFELRIGLPWIRSMPVSSLVELAVGIDGRTVDPDAVHVALGGKSLQPAALAELSDSWWFLQDRLVLEVDRTLAAGVHAVSVDMRLLVPYLEIAPGDPLILPLRLEADLVLDSPPVPSVTADVG